MFLFDTDAISELMRKKPSPLLLKKLAKVSVNEQATTSITLAELSYGAHRAGRPELFDIATRLLYGVRIFNFDSLAAKTYGPLRARLEKAGTPLDEPDLRIAAIAVTHGLSIVTGNIKHFERVQELTVENWLRA